MSWSINFIGTPDAVVSEVETYSNKLTGASKQEYDEVKDALKAVVSANVVASDAPYGVIVSLEASGHASFTDNKKTYGNMTVSLKPFYGTICKGETN